ncbi:hypothetical protein LTR09_005047 [Extremus antarcticus]|uniref:Uncharacterized protein n=1 Tax=Extremus antarcticus TaxID=702011 RepID=A0AAJ0DH47_9PEZI|nr:hypothetical protein LTR09_005047 [Extremus antarcticus]
MPMIWNAEADAKLMAKVIQICNVKLDAAQMRDVAASMGTDCTAKAISHRLTHFRKLGGTDAATKAAATKGKTAAKPNKVTKTPAKGKGKKSKAEVKRTPSAAAEGEEEYATPPPTTRVKRAGAKRNYAEMSGEEDGEGESEVAETPEPPGPVDEESESKRPEPEIPGLPAYVKIEVGEDIGEGLRTAADGEDEEDDDY